MWASEAQSLPSSVLYNFPGRNYYWLGNFRSVSGEATKAGVVQLSGPGGRCINYLSFGATVVGIRPLIVVNKAYL